jgi:hypothetical protein
MDRMRHGREKECHPNDLNYEGYIRKGELHHGRINWPKGDSYVGEFRNGVPHGQGKFIKPNGSIWEGEWFQGVAVGGGIRFVRGENLEKDDRTTKAAC